MTTKDLLKTGADAEAAPAAFDLAAAQAVLIEEAACLDEKRWDDWLAHYCDDATYWVPAWKDYSSVTTDPETELSLIYYTKRTGLEERLWRLTSGQSLASLPLARTLHCVNNVRLDRSAADVVHANVVVHVYNQRKKEAIINFGNYRYRLVRQDGELRIAEKYIVLLNDYFPSSIDVYTI